MENRILWHPVRLSKSVSCQCIFMAVRTGCLPQLLIQTLEAFQADIGKRIPKLPNTLPGCVPSFFFNAVPDSNPEAYFPSLTCQLPLACQVVSKALYLACWLKDCAARRGLSNTLRLANRVSVAFSTFVVISCLAVPFFLTAAYLSSTFDLSRTWIYTHMCIVKDVPRRVSDQLSNGSNFECNVTKWLESMQIPSIDRPRLPTDLSVLHELYSRNERAINSPFEDRKFRIKLPIFELIGLSTM